MNREIFSHLIRDFDGNGHRCGFLSILTPAITLPQPAARVNPTVNDNVLTLEMEPSRSPVSWALPRRTRTRSRHLFSSQVLARGPVADWRYATGCGFKATDQQAL